MTGTELTSKASCTLNIPHTMDNVQHNTDIMNLVI